MARNESVPSTIDGPLRIARDTKTYDDFDGCLIRRKVYDLYSKGQQVTIKMLKEKLLPVEATQWVIRRFNQLSKEIFEEQARKKDEEEVYVYEKPTITDKRKSYLQKIKEVRQAGKNVVYIDEAWPWMKEDAAFSPPQLRRSKWFVIAAGTKDGWLSGTLPTETEEEPRGSKRNNEGQIISLDGTRFIDWVKAKLLPNLPEESTIVMDNASYHTVQTDASRNPTNKWNKQKLLDWFEKQKTLVPVDPRDRTKKALLRKAKEFKLEPKYEFDDLMVKNGHQVLRLPPYHSELNLLDSVWNQVKDEANLEMKKSSKITPKEAFTVGLQRIEKKHWANKEEKVIRCEDKYRSKDPKVVKMVSQMKKSLDAETCTKKTDGPSP